MKMVRLEKSVEESWRRKKGSLGRCGSRQSVAGRGSSAKRGRLEKVSASGSGDRNKLMW